MQHQRERKRGRASKIDDSCDEKVGVVASCLVEASIVAGRVSLAMVD